MLPVLGELREEPSHNRNINDGHNREEIVVFGPAPEAGRRWWKTSSDDSSNRSSDEWRRRSDNNNRRTLRKGGSRLLDEQHNEAPTQVPKEHSKDWKVPVGHVLTSTTPSSVSSLPRPKSFSQIKTQMTNERDVKVPTSNGNNKHEVTRNKRRASSSRPRVVIMDDDEGVSNQDDEDNNNDDDYSYTNSLVKLVKMITHGNAWKARPEESLRRLLREKERRLPSARHQTVDAYAKENPLDVIHPEDWETVDSPNDIGNIHYWEKEDDTENNNNIRGEGDNEENDNRTPLLSSIKEINMNDNDLLNTNENSKRDVEIGYNDDKEEEILPSTARSSVVSGLTDDDKRILLEEERQKDVIDFSNPFGGGEEIPVSVRSRDGLSRGDDYDKMNKRHQISDQDEPILLETLYESLKYDPPDDLLASYVNRKDDEIVDDDNIADQQDFITSNEVPQQTTNKFLVNDKVNRLLPEEVEERVEIPEDDSVVRRPILSWKQEWTKWKPTIGNTDKRGNEFEKIDTDDTDSSMLVGESPLFNEQLSVDDDDFANWFASKRIDVKKPGPRFPPPTNEDEDLMEDGGSDSIQSTGMDAASGQGVVNDINKDLKLTPKQKEEVNQLLQMSIEDQHAHSPQPVSHILKSPHGVSTPEKRIDSIAEREEDEDSSRQHIFFMTSVIAVFIATVAFLLATVVVVVRRHEILRRKLANLLGHLDITDTMSAYQDLCRQRMKSQQQTAAGTNDDEVGNPSDDPEGQLPSTSKAGQSTSSLGINRGGGERQGDQRTSTRSTNGKSTSLSSESGSSTLGPTSGRSSTSSWNEEAAASHMDISTGHMILSYMEDHLRNRDRLNKEWEGLCSYEADQHSTTIANLPANRKKNRYIDILPYDHFRVILGAGTPSPNSKSSTSSSVDYINASAITDHDLRNPAYIATQGPLPNTTTDFWQMIWEQGSQTIVMLTRLVESGVSMCHRYWPEEGFQKHGFFEVSLVSEHVWCEDYLVRTFLLRNVKTGEKRMVTQLQFLSWPEKAIPSSAKAILNFRRKVNKSSKGKSSPSSSPIVVHCSDGSGRTGTYCLIDMVLNRMSKGAKEIDIAATLEHLRDQRMEMVRTKGQFEYVLKAVAEEVQAVLRTLQASPSRVVANSTSGR